MRGFKCSKKGFLWILLILISAVAMVNTASASPIRVLVDPLTIIDHTLVPGTEFSINITVDYVDKLTSYQFIMFFNPSVLHGVSVAPGPFLASAGGSPIFYPGVGFDNDLGVLYLVVEALRPPPSTPPPQIPSGGGVLATVTFEVVGIGSSPLTLGPETGLINMTGGWEFGDEWCYGWIPEEEYPGGPVTDVPYQPWRDSLGHGYFDNRLVYVDPAQIRGVPIDESFTVNLSVANVEDMYAWGLYVNWTASLLNVTSITEGDFLKDQPEGTSFFSDPHDEEGYMYVNGSTVGDHPGVGGSGTLATVTFLVEENGNSDLHLYDTLFLNSTSQQMILNTADGWFANAKHTLMVNSTPITGVEFTLDGVEFPLSVTTYTTNFSKPLEEQYYAVTMPSRTWILGTEYAFYNWSDSLTDLRRTVDLTADINLTANYGEIPHVHNLNTTLDYMTIQEAIDAVETSDGHVIFVDGTAVAYSETITVSKSVKLIGENTNTTIIDGTGTTGTLLYVTADNVEISGFTVRNGDSEGIFLDGSNGSIVRGNIVLNCSYDGVTLIDAHNNTVTHNLLLANVWTGIYIDSSSNNTIYANTIDSTEEFGLYLFNTEDNMIVSNTISNSSIAAIELYTSNDTLYHNNFLHNVEQVSDLGSDTTWDNGFEGNYWSDYNGTDDGTDGRTAGDGIGDTDLPHQGVDNYPLMNPWPMEWNIIFEDETYPVTTVSNSTVTYMAFSQLDKQISFNVTGPDGTTGFGNITIPKDLLDAPIDQWIILVNGTEVYPDPIVTENATHTFIYFTYSHSTQIVQMTGTNPADNTPPTADAGPDQTVDEDTLVTFDGSGSTDNIGITSYTWTFVDVTSQTLSGVGPTYTFATLGVYTVTLNVTDARGNWATDSVVITVLDVTNPVADAGSDQTVDEDTLVTFDGSGSIDNVGITSYTWTFVDVTLQTLTGVNPTYTFQAPGVYAVVLNVSDAAGNWATDEVIITVLDVTAPVADAGSDQTVDEDTLVTFDGSGSSDNVGIVSYAWTFIDVTPQTLSGVNPTYTFATPGVYTVTLNVSDAAGNGDGDTVEITVLDVTDPVADAGSDQTVDEDTLVTLEGWRSVDNVDVTSWTWTFTDVTPQTLTEENATYTFAAPGVYTVTLNVTDARANWATDSVVITVLDVTNPVADAGLDQTVDEDTLVTFDGSGSSDNVGVVSYAWDFGDGTAETGVTPTHTYSEPGTYIVTLNVSDAAGNSDTDTVEITVLDVTDPVADAGSDQTVDEDTEVAFDASGSTDNVGIVGYAWDFGDGTTGIGVTSTHTYSEPGTYTVTLTVEDAVSNTDTDTMIVTVQAAPEGFPIWIVGVAVAAIVVVIAAIAVFMRRSKG